MGCWQGPAVREGAEENIGEMKVEKGEMGGKEDV